MKTLPWLCCFIVLSSCVPASDGRSVQRALEWQPAETLALPTARTTYVSVALPPSLFGYDDDDISRLGRLNIDYYDAIGTSHNQSIAREFSLGEVTAPDGWVINLERAYLVREIEDRTRRASYYTETFEFTFALTLPSEAADAREVVLLTLRSPEGTEVIPLFVQPQAG